MSVTNDIAKEIVEMCKESETKEFSREVMEDYGSGYVEEFIKEIEGKLKAKGITVI